MEIWVVLLFMVFFALKALSQDTTDWVRIDCGSEISYPSGDIRWQTDDEFIKTGKNKQVSRSSYSSLEILNTLRAFTQQNKNCYTLPTPTPARYFIRAVFYYGNYDGLSKPPTFDLDFDGNKWATVETSLTDLSYYELVYANKGDNISVCLARTFHDQFPFISSLELWPLPDNMYAGMSRDSAWLQSYRYNYGADETDWILGYPLDIYNRIWKPMIPTGLIPVQADFSSLYYTTVEYPPPSAITDAVSAPNPTDTISLQFTFSKTNTLNHVVVYFTEVAFNINETRSFDFYVNDKFIITIRPEYENCTGAWANAPTLGTMKVELRPPLDSVLPPVISAIEVYTASDPLVTVGTSQDDLDGLAVLISTFEQLEGWSGDPCLPSDTIWQWVNCIGNDPPRVTSLNLSGYGLDGSLPDFTQMQALETIDLGNNSLQGSIPDFLGKLPSLKLLNLSFNNFSGEVPQSITKNKKIKYQINGNPSLHHHKGKNLGLIIGLAVGLPVGLILVFALVYFLTRKKPMSGQGQVITGLGMSQGNGTAQGKPQGENVSMSTRTEGLIKPSQTNQNVMVVPTGENISMAGNAGNGHINPMPVGEQIPVSTGAGSINHPSEVPAGIDRAELDELIRLQYGNMGTHGRA